MKKLLSILTVLLFLIYSCDVVQKPYLEQSGQCGHDNLSVPIKKILVEDYTGFKCGNCPEAHELLQGLINNYCDHIVAVSLHVGYFARPSVSPPYNIDFRTEAGEEYNEYFGAEAAGLPVGMVDRTEFNGSRLLNPNAWADAIVSELEKPLLLDVEVHNTYNDTSRKVNIKVDVAALQDLTANLYLSVWVTEDSIIAPQKDYRRNPPDILNYVHRHVFRGAVNSTWGDQIVNGTLEKGSVLSFSFSTVLDTAWNADHCHIVAFVYKYDDKSVLQADEEKVK